MVMKVQETRNFQSEVKQLLHLMINSLYSNKEIFLRELISNASDAADKLKFKALSNNNLYENDNKLKVQISINKKEKLIIINDNGIGMTRDEVIENLGTIAKSGTKSFIESLKITSKKLEENKQPTQFIGQFGVGFYSSFIVANKVSVKTRAAGIAYDKGVFWESTGENNYNITNIYKKSRGTEITLHIRENNNEFLDIWRIKNIISKYSDHISLPIEIQTYDEKNKQYIWEQINKAQAIWLRNKSEISDSEYKEFYKQLTHDTTDPIAWTHNHVEGKQEYTSLLYIPFNVPWDVRNRDHKNGIKLYVQRVFIMDDAEQLLPKYLRFIKGLVDSNDLPLNISREILQDNNIIYNMKNMLTKKVLNMLTNISKTKDLYNDLWQKFGLILKEGPAEDLNNKDRIIKLLRFASTYNNNSIQNVSLESYINRMIEGQKKIYFLTADNYLAAKSSPHLEFFSNKKIEVLLLTDHIDEWMMSYITDFQEKPLQLISKKDESLNDFIKKKDNLDNDINKKTLNEFIKKVENLLGNKIKKVYFTDRLFNTPAIVTTDTNEMSTQMAKLFAAAGQQTPEIKYNFELNSNHTLIKKAMNIKDEKYFTEFINLLLEEAIFAEKGTLENPNIFINRINYFLSKDKI
ncbi:molecular chaperone HtpG [Enterobacteriaceae endosymbiont of Plateumaris consimilis]|uniref:molecular chaperone HtpG n=1 Tax=Enterobacteriaceae endosymbiont of Plateumaris consimilis TaxID=2675794 RepID=UPI00144903D9|nr:molecular chaperone HtpG [Enterobacteriaceae endosymbiont of Plateumaris consimilis]QJC28743.1 molecular chaperone HtpG [Enterobacteriaceae endosymbiont of Plateumaris consimilis]